MTKRRPEDEESDEPGGKAYRRLVEFESLRGRDVEEPQPSDDQDDDAKARSADTEEPLESEENEGS